MLKLEVFDPPMCCATGICGNNVDPKLVTFASDLEWLKKQGIDVLRYGLSFEPAEFVKNKSVKSTLQTEGNESLPIVIIDNKIVSKACYPTRKKLAELCNLEYKEELGGCCVSGCDCTNSPAEDNCCSPNCDCSSQQPEESCGCGPDCDCHKSALSDNAKKILFIAIILAMLAIIGIKIVPKAHSAEVAYPSISSYSQVKPSQEVAFVYVPAKNRKISNKVNSAMLSAKQTLEKKNIKVDLYILNPSSTDYSAQTKTPAVTVIYKGKGKSTVSGDINATRLLQAYMAATLSGGCGAGCPCHKH